MQLLFTPEEFQVLADILEQYDRDLRDEIVGTENSAFKHSLEKKQQLLEELENRVIRKQLELSTDELDLLGEVLAHSDRELLMEIARTDHREFRHALQKKEGVVRQIHDKVVEVCAMF